MAPMKGLESKKLVRRAKNEEDKSYELVHRKRREQGTFCKAFLRFIFSHVGLVLLCVLIAVGGAQIFLLMEKPVEDKAYELKKERAQKVNEAQLFMRNAFWWYVHDDDYAYNETKYYEVAEARLREFISYIITDVKEYRYDGTIDGWDEQWTFPNALLFTISIMTVIGYGNVAPVTAKGQLFCIFYSIIAIATFLIMLANVGSGLAQGLIYTYSRCCCRWFRSARLNSEIPSRTLRKKLKRRLVDDVVGEEHYMPTDRITIPIIVNLVLIFGYVFLGALLFSSWEGWGFITSFYFSFITLTTIGFGDYTPTESFGGIGKTTDFGDQVKMIVSILYCSLGLAILSLCVSLIQEQMSKKAAKVLHGQEEKIVMDEVKVIQRRPTVQEGCEEVLAVKVKRNDKTAPFVAPVLEPDVEEGLQKPVVASRPGSNTSTLPGSTDVNEQEEEEENEGQNDEVQNGDQDKNDDEDNGDENNEENNDNDEDEDDHDDDDDEEDGNDDEEEE